ncbi:Uu.00g145120.m01.CDS01 [Anthostomella pinea]|uniref:non-specific serine/threonine protein kinase n=1 Tax=Anthostomella pinea TaxID=933095 RepID=A0AAI8VR29_9PEZI|nr:Uu.00g145120.m01.CDS01 [Anthostomella pinea]
MTRGRKRSFSHMGESYANLGRSRSFRTEMREERSVPRPRRRRRTPSSRPRGRSPPRRPRRPTPPPAQPASRSRRQSPGFSPRRTFRQVRPRRRRSPTPPGEGLIYAGLPFDTSHEDREEYRPGGLHPVHISDTLDQGRYEVFDKLGYGAHATVWLCRDWETRKWRAVKIVRARDSTEDHPELKAIHLLDGISREELKQQHIFSPLRHFWIRGPNGHHLSFVSEVLAPLLPLYAFVRKPQDKIASYCLQVSRAVQFLHKRGICHGDIRMSNLAIQLDEGIHDISVRELGRYLKEPHRHRLDTLSGRPPGPWGPDYLVLRNSMQPLVERFGKDKLALIDFGLSYEASSPVKGSNFYRQNAGPEYLFGTGPVGYESDTWALACVIWNIADGRALVEDTESFHQVAQTLEWLFGPLPVMYKKGLDEHLREEAVTDRAGVPGVAGPKEAICYNADPLCDRNTIADGDPLSLHYNLDEYKKKVADRQQNHGWENPVQAYFGSMRQTDWEFIDSRLKAINDEEANTDKLTEIKSNTCSSRSTRRAQAPSSLDSGHSQTGSNPHDYQPQLAADITHQEGEECLANDGKLDGQQTNLDTEDEISRESPTYRDGIDNELGKPKLEQTTFTQGAATGKARASQRSSGVIPTQRERFLQQILPFEQGNYPNSENPCTCYSSDPSESDQDGCKAGSHWNTNPEHVRMMRWSKEEVVSISDLLLKMFKLDPKERVGIDEVVRHL